MTRTTETVRVLYSFPHRLGAARICHTAWQQVNGLLGAGASVLVFAGSLSRELPPEAVIRPTLAYGKFRIPYRVLGTERACALHDWIVSQRLKRLAGKIDIVHAWPLGSLRTLRTAASLGIPTVLERPNAHTRFAYEVVQKECEKLGIVLPPGHEHAYKADVFRRRGRGIRCRVSSPLSLRFRCPDFSGSGLSAGNGWRAINMDTTRPSIIRVSRCVTIDAA